MSVWAVGVVVNYYGLFKDTLITKSPLRDHNDTEEIRDHMIT